MRSQLLTAPAALFVAVSLAACIGNIGDRSPGGEDGLKESSGAGAGSGECEVGCTESGIEIAASSQFPRLSHTQWEETIVDLFYLDAPTGLAASFAPDPLGGKAFANNQEALDVTPTLWADYQTAAETVAAMVTSDPAQLAAIAPDGDATAFIETFGARAYRRPLDASEVTAKQAIFDQGAALYPELDPFQAGVRLSLEAFLQSPHFVYRPELAETDAGNGLVELSSWEIASRLSYALWNTMPDADLFAAAASGELDTAAGLEAEVDRMLAHPRARVVLRAFFDQLYEAEQYENLSKSPTLYPDFDPALGAEMRAELSKFVEHIVFDLEGGAKEILTSTTTFVTPGLAEIYGIPSGSLPAPDADGFSQVDLDPAQRAGLLTRLGFLAWKGTETQPDTILRGVFLNRKIICMPLGDPPDEAMGAELGDEKTNREKVNALTGPGTCGATCHATYINPAGFAFEHYGAIGEYRNVDNGEPIDSAATYPFADGDKSYADAIELSKILADSPQVHGCFAGFWIEYLLGRGRSDSDDLLVDKLAALSTEGASTLGVVRALLVSDAIRYRLVAEEAP